MEQKERRRTKPEFNGCIRYKRGEYCQPCVAMASNYTYVGIIDRRAVFHQYTNTPSPREQKLVEALQTAKVSAQAIYKCVHHGHPTGGDDDTYISVHTDIIKDTATEALAYDKPGSQGGEKAPSGEEYLGFDESERFIKEILEKPDEEEKAPISEEEAVEIMAKGYDEHRVYVQDSHNVHHIRLVDAYRALAKRLGWM